MTGGKPVTQPPNLQTSQQLVSASDYLDRNWSMSLFFGDFEDHITKTNISLGDVRICWDRSFPFSPNGFFLSLHLWDITCHIPHDRWWYPLSLIPLPTQYIPDALWCWYIYRQNWVIFGVNVGKYSSTMEHMGIFMYISLGHVLVDMYWCHMPELADVSLGHLPSPDHNFQQIVCWRLYSQ